MKNISTTLVIITLGALVCFQQTTSRTVKATIYEIKQSEAEPARICCFHDMPSAQIEGNKDEVDWHMSLLKKLVVHPGGGKTHIVIETCDDNSWSRTGTHVADMFRAILRQEGVKKSRYEQKNICDECVQCMTNVSNATAYALSRESNVYAHQALNSLAHRLCTDGLEKPFDITVFDNGSRIAMTAMLTLCVPVVLLLKESGYDSTELESYFNEHELTITKFFQDFDAHLHCIKQHLEECLLSVSKNLQLKKTLGFKILTLDSWITAAHEAHEKLLKKACAVFGIDKKALAGNVPLYKLLLALGKQELTVLKGYCHNEPWCEALHQEVLYDPDILEDDEDELGHRLSSNYVIEKYFRMCLGNDLLNVMRSFLQYRAIAGGINLCDAKLLWLTLRAPAGSRLMIYTGMAHAHVLQKALAVYNVPLLFNTPLINNQGEVFDSWATYTQWYIQKAYMQGEEVVYSQDPMQRLGSDILSLDSTLDNTIVQRV